MRRIETSGCTGRPAKRAERAALEARTARRCTRSCGNVERGARATTGMSPPGATRARWVAVFTDSRVGPNEPS